MDKIFDKIYNQDHLMFTTISTFFSFPVFVIQEIDTQDKRKDCIIVDIQKLNKIVFLDS